jgi:hypothetical protein
VSVHFMTPHFGRKIQALHLNVYRYGVTKFLGFNSTAKSTYVYVYILCFCYPD